jgi:hypothetical protein
MTPYNHATSFLRNGCSTEEVVARLAALGLSASDARTAVRAARSRLAEEEAPVGQLAPRQVERPLEAGSPVQPGFHGLLLIASIMLVMAAAANLVLSVMLVSTPKETLALLFPSAGPPISLRLLTTVLMVTGTVLLMYRRRVAIAVLIGWAALFSAESALYIVFVREPFTGLAVVGVFGAAVATTWLAYFLSSRQLRATLTR